VIEKARKRERERWEEEEVALFLGPFYPRTLAGPALHSMVCCCAAAAGGGNKVWPVWRSAF
jgi:hypothetical protein